jgi:hypothetical protein
MPVGGAVIFDAALQSLFTTTLDEPYINVVCAPPNFMLGSAVRVRDCAPGTGVDAQMTTHIRIDAADEDEEIVYEPQSALCGLFTVGCANVAITGVHPMPSHPHELECLRRYSRVITPAPAEAAALRHLGVEASFVPGDGVALAVVLNRL